MKKCLVDFRDMQWQSDRPGMRFKTYAEGDQKLKLVEFSDQLCEGEWCTLGHVGFMLEGSMTVEFEERRITFNAGDGIFVPGGHRHKASMARGRTAVAVFVEGSS